MKIAVMQPYLFPYIGYWQLINAADIFVIYDDVTFIKGGWINRNNILCNSEKHLFGLPLQKASYKKKINEIQLANHEIHLSKLIKTIENSYKKAPYYSDAFKVILEILLHNDVALSNLLHRSIILICDYLEIKTKIIVSSDIEKDCELKGQDKIIQIVKKLNGNHYINSIGGQSLYSKKYFLQNNIDLSFIKSKNILYKQFNKEFVSFLSIIDIIMFNHKEKIRDFLDEFEFV